MQIQKANTVNFGQVKYEYERPSMKRTPNQEEALEKIETELFVSDLEKKLEEKKEADLVIKFRTNGNIDMFVKKELPSAPLETPKFYTPFTQDGKEKLFAKFNLKPGTPKALFKSSLESFIKKCEKYTSAPNCAKNRRTESKAEAELETTLSKLEKEGKLDSAIALDIEQTFEKMGI